MFVSQDWYESVIQIHSQLNDDQREKKMRQKHKDCIEFTYFYDYRLHGIVNANSFFIWH